MLQTSLPASRATALRIGARPRTARPKPPGARLGSPAPGERGPRPPAFPRAAGALPSSSPEPHSAPTPAPVSARTPGRWHGLARRLRGALGNESGAATAEYAVVIMAAVGFAGLLVIIMQSDEVRGFLVGLVQRALGSAG